MTVAGPTCPAPNASRLGANVPKPSVFPVVSEPGLLPSKAVPPNVTLWPLIPAPAGTELSSVTVTLATNSNPHGKSIPPVVPSTSSTVKIVVVLCGFIKIVWLLPVVIGGLLTSTAENSKVSVTLFIS